MPCVCEFNGLREWRESPVASRAVDASSAWLWAQVILWTISRQTQVIPIPVHVMKCGSYVAFMPDGENSNDLWRGSVTTLWNDEFTWCFNERKCVILFRTPVSWYNLSLSKHGISVIAKVIWGNYMSLHLAHFTNWPKSGADSSINRIKSKTSVSSCRLNTATLQSLPVLIYLCDTGFIETFPHL